MKSTHDYLKLYDQDCVLVHRPEGGSWAGRVNYKSEQYDKNTPYNHRSVFDNEVVFDFDDDDLQKNEAHALLLCYRLKQDNVGYTLWWSGNKGHHVHTLWCFDNETNVPLMKRLIMKHYVKSGDGKIDLQLAGPHMIRAECALNEKSGNNKTLLDKSNFLQPGVVPPEVRNDYNHQLRNRISRVYNNGSIASHPDVQYFIKTHEFGAKSDGHERALWMLCQVLKNQWKDDKQGFIKHMQEWYRASGGSKLSDFDVMKKVSYHWNRDYRVTTQSFIYLREEIGS
jgi:hypothetical protein